MKCEVTERLVIFLQQHTIANLCKLLRDSNRINNLDGSGELLKCDPSRWMHSKDLKVLPRAYQAATTGREMRIDGTVDADALLTSNHADESHF